MIEYVNGPIPKGNICIYIYIYIYICIYVFMPTVLPSTCNKLHLCPGSNL